ncbi:MAG: selenide, water dikinase SelD [Desulfobacterales bacterium]|nr:selenide, water dikinase SelD [Desulfobacterales bacterium]
MAGLPQNQDPNLLVGFDTSDDAGVYRLTDEIAVVTTADFITPPVDDPYRFGEIAAANALGDVYAMGGRPVACLNLVCFPSRKLPAEVLQQIVAGALGKITEAGAVLAGGHSVEDDEPKFGLAVTGVVHPKRVWRNSGAQPGDVLVLTKPIGSGVLFNANLKGWVSDHDLEKCLQVVSTLNRRAAEVLAGNTVNAATDVTGFGLAGHAFEMAKASRACLEIDIGAVPVMDGALKMYRKGMSTGSNDLNRRLVAADTVFSRELPPWHEQIFYDPQTSGGLLVSIPEAGARERIDALHAAGIVHAAPIGRVIGRREGPYLSFL